MIEITFVYISIIPLLFIIWYIYNIYHKKLYNNIQENSINISEYSRSMSNLSCIIQRSYSSYIITNNS